MGRPVGLLARGNKKKKSNGVHPPNRGHGAQGQPRRTTVPGADGNGVSMEQTQSNRPFRDLATQALATGVPPGAAGPTLTPLEAAKARKRRLAVKDQETKMGFLSTDEKLLLSGLAEALREHTDTMREAHGLDPIDRSEEETEFVPPEPEVTQGDPISEEELTEMSSSGGEENDEPAPEKNDEPASEKSDEAPESD